MKSNPGYRSNSLLPFLTAVIMTALCLGPAHAAPDIGLRFSAASYNSISSLSGLQTGIQPGFMMEATADLASFDVFADKPDNGIHRPAFLADAGVQAFWFGTSSPSTDGNLYRAWRGFSAVVMAGVRFPIFPIRFLKASGAFHALGGARLMSTKYTGTGLLSANPALALRFGLDASFGGGLRWGLELPIEVAFKSGGVATIFGVSGVIILDKWKKTP